MKGRTDQNDPLPSAFSDQVADGDGLFMGIPAGRETLKISGR
jgi:hypothetical protein